jgi:hypothetical protein
MKYISGDPAPEQLHSGSLAIRRIDTRTAELEDFPLVRDNRRDVVFVGRIEAPKAPGRVPPKQPIRSDDGIAAPAISVVEDEQVIAVIIKAIKIAPSSQHFGQWLCPQVLIKYPVAQRLYCVDVRSCFR